MVLHLQRSSGYRDSVAGRARAARLLGRSSGGSGCAAQGPPPGRHAAVGATALRLWRTLPPMNRALIVLGAFLVILGLGWSWFRHVPLFRLPGDIVIDRPGFKLFLPITTMLLNQRVDLDPRVGTPALVCEA